MSKKINQQFNCSKMMLPEHCGSLREHVKNLEREEIYRFPVIDEQLWEEQQRMFGQALFTGHTIKINVINSSGSHTYRGVPLRIDQVAGLILVDTGKTGLLKIRATEITRLELLDCD
ncbi:MAG: YolD-like family protein [Dethiobacteria bacterium]